MATFMSTEKGPCMAMMWAGAKPAAAQASSDEAIGSTRGQKRACQSGTAV